MKSRLVPKPVLNLFTLFASTGFAARQRCHRHTGLCRGDGRQWQRRHSLQTMAPAACQRSPHQCQWGFCNCMPQPVNVRRAPAQTSVTFAADYTITLVGSQLPAIPTGIIINGNGAANTIIQANIAPNTATYRL